MTADADEQVERDLGAEQAQRLFDWRLAYALRLDYDVETSERIAAKPWHQLDLHELESLIGRGCSRERALEILS